MAQFNSNNIKGSANSDSGIKDLLFILKEENPYLILNVPETVDLETVSKIYKQLARQYHPDKFSSLRGSPEYKDIELIFSKVTKAFNTIKDPQQRKQYDLEAKLKKLIAEDHKSRIQTTSPGLNHNFDMKKTKEEIKQEQSKTMFMSGKKYLNEGDFDKAIECFKFAVTNKPEDAEYHSHLGLAMMNKGWNGYAQAEFKVALNYNPNDEIALRHYKILSEVNSGNKNKTQPKNIQDKINKEQTDNSFFGKIKSLIRIKKV
jgi:curved DNA-binding protein CbpA